MNKEIKEKWLAALRSGKYVQSTGALRKPGDAKDSFCCLGVLCDAVDPSGWYHVSHEVAAVAYGFGQNDRVTTVLPHSIMARAGLGSSGYFRISTLPEGIRQKVRECVDYFDDSMAYNDNAAKPRDVTSLAILNDIGASFEFIAKVIEADPEWIVFSDET